MPHCSQLDVNKNNYLVCYSFVYTLCINNNNYNNYTTDLCNGDLQTTITLFRRTASSHKADKTSLTHLPALLCLLYDTVNSLMNVLEGKCSWLRLQEISTNVNNVVYINSCSVVCVFLFTCLLFFFILVFVVILSSKIICKQGCLLHYFVFVDFVYNFHVKLRKCKALVSRFLNFLTAS